MLILPQRQVQMKEVYRAEMVVEGCLLLEKARVIPVATPAFLLLSKSLPGTSPQRGLLWPLYLSSPPTTYFILTYSLPSTGPNWKLWC